MSHIHHLAASPRHSTRAPSPPPSVPLSPQDSTFSSCASSNFLQNETFSTEVTINQSLLRPIISPRDCSFLQFDLSSSRNHFISTSGRRFSLTLIYTWGLTSNLCTTHLLHCLLQALIWKSSNSCVCREKVRAPNRTSTNLCCWVQSLFAGTTVKEDLNAELYNNDMHLPLFSKCLC